MSAGVEPLEQEFLDLIAQLERAIVEAKALSDEALGGANRAKRAHTRITDFVWVPGGSDGWTSGLDGTETPGGVVVGNGTGNGNGVEDDG